MSRSGFFRGLYPLLALLLLAAVLFPALHLGHADHHPESCVLCQILFFAPCVTTETAAITLEPSSCEQELPFARRAQPRDAVIASTLSRAPPTPSFA